MAMMNQQVQGMPPWMIPGYQQPAPPMTVPQGGEWFPSVPQPPPVAAPPVPPGGQLGPVAPPQMGEGVYQPPFPGQQPQQYPFPEPQPQPQYPTEGPTQIPTYPQGGPMRIPGSPGYDPRVLEENLKDDNKIQAAAKKLAASGLMPPSIEDSALAQALQGIKAPDIEPTVLGSGTSTNLGGAGGSREDLIRSLYGQSARGGRVRQPSPITPIGTLLMGGG